MRRSYLILVAIALSPGGLFGQPDRDSPANCHGLVTASIASQRAHGDMRRCAEILASELAEVLRRTAPRTLDTVRFAHVLSFSYQIRSPELFAAALELAASNLAPAAARVLGLAVAVAQYDPNISFQGAKGAGTLFTEARSALCTESLYLVQDGHAWYSAPLPADAGQRLWSVSAALRDEESQPVLVRRFANCIARFLPEPPPAAISPSDISVEADCRGFWVRNHTAARLEMQALLEGAEGEPATIVVVPHGRELVPHDGLGTLRLTQDSRVIARVPVPAGCSA